MFVDVRTELENELEVGTCLKVLDMRPSSCRGFSLLHAPFRPLVSLLAG